MKSDKTLVLFDFDGTLTSRDSLFEFTRMTVGAFPFLAGLLFLSIPLVLLRMKLASSHWAKEAFLTHFFRGMPFTRFQQHCRQFAATVIPQLVRPQAIGALRDHVNRGHRVVIVSASPQDWIAPWAGEHGAEVIATRLEIRDGHLTGKILGRNCNGEEKVNRLREAIHLGDYGKVIVYGDSRGDYAMMEIAHERHFKPFRDRKSTRTD